MKNVLKVLLTLVLALTMAAAQSATSECASKPKATKAATLQTAVLKDGLLTDKGSSFLLIPVVTKCTPYVCTTKAPVCGDGNSAYCLKDCQWQCRSDCGPVGPPC